MLNLLKLIRTANLNISPVAFKILWKIITIGLVQWNAPWLMGKCAHGIFDNFNYRRPKIGIKSERSSKWETVFLHVYLEKLCIWPYFASWRMMNVAKAVLFLNWNSLCDRQKQTYKNFISTCGWFQVWLPRPGVCSRDQTEYVTTRFLQKEFLNGLRSTKPDLSYNSPKLCLSPNFKKWFFVNVSNNYHNRP